MKEDNPSMDEEEKTKENEEKDKLIDELLNISQSKPERFSVRSIKKSNILILKIGNKIILLYYCR